jgi:hypothetical protein
MSNPLLLIKKMNDGAENFATAMSQFKKKPKAKKAKKAKAVKKKKPAAKKKDKVVEPPRPSPFALHDEVWVNTGYNGWSKTKITKTIKPSGGAKQWTYEVGLATVGHILERNLLPAKIFTMMATDAIRMKDADFTLSLNTTFEATARILAVYRHSQKRPWAYYVIPDPDVLYKDYKWVAKVYGYNQNMQDILYVRPVKDIDLKLMPVSSAPQEILTYLGLHIYNRKWRRDENAT